MTTENQQRPMQLSDDELRIHVRQAIAADPNATCLQCGTLFPRTERNHWRICPAHPARELVDRLLRERAEMIALLERLRRMAPDPMKSLDAGRVIDAPLVAALCEDALDKLRARS